MQPDSSGSRTRRLGENLLSSGNAPTCASLWATGASFMAKPECPMIRLRGVYGDCDRNTPFPHNRQ